MNQPNETSDPNGIISDGISAVPAISSFRSYLTASEARELDNETPSFTYEILQDSGKIDFWANFVLDSKLPELFTALDKIISADKAPVVAPRKGLRKIIFGRKVKPTVSGRTLSDHPAFILTQAEAKLALDLRIFTVSSEEAKTALAFGAQLEASLDYLESQHMGDGALMTAVTSIEELLPRVTSLAAARLELASASESIKNNQELLVSDLRAANQR